MLFPYMLMIRNHVMLAGALYDEFRYSGLEFATSASLTWLNMDPSLMGCAVVDLSALALLGSQMSLS